MPASERQLDGSITPRPDRTNNASLDLSRGTQVHGGRISSSLAEHRRALSLPVDESVGQQAERVQGQGVQSRELLRSSERSQTAPASFSELEQRAVPPEHSHHLSLEKGEGYSGGEMVVRRIEDISTEVEVLRQYIGKKENEIEENESHMVKLFKNGSENVKRGKLNKILDDLDDIEKTGNTAGYGKINALLVSNGINTIDFYNLRKQNKDLKRNFDKAQENLDTLHRELDVHTQSEPRALYMEASEQPVLTSARQMEFTDPEQSVASPEHSPHQRLEEVSGEETAAQKVENLLARMEARKNEMTGLKISINEVKDSMTRLFSGPISSETIQSVLDHLDEGDRIGELKNGLDSNDHAYTEKFEKLSLQQIGEEDNVDRIIEPYGEFNSEEFGNLRTEYKSLKGKLSSAEEDLRNAQRDLGEIFKDPLHPESHGASSEERSGNDTHQRLERESQSDGETPARRVDILLARIDAQESHTGGIKKNIDEFKQRFPNFEEMEEEADTFQYQLSRMGESRGKFKDRGTDDGNGEQEAGGILDTREQEVGRILDTREQKVRKDMKDFFEKNSVSDLDQFKKLQEEYKTLLDDLKDAQANELALQEELHRELEASHLPDVSPSSAQEELRVPHVEDSQTILTPIRTESPGAEQHAVSPEDLSHQPSQKKDQSDSEMIELSKGVTFPRDDMKANIDRSSVPESSIQAPFYLTREFGELQKEVNQRLDMIKRLEKVKFKETDDVNIKDIENRQLEIEVHMMVLLEKNGIRNISEFNDLVEIREIHEELDIIPEDLHPSKAPSQSTQDELETPYAELASVRTKSPDLLPPQRILGSSGSDGKLHLRGPRARSTRDELIRRASSEDQTDHHFGPPPLRSQSDDQFPTQKASLSDQLSASSRSTVTSLWEEVASELSLSELGSLDRMDSPDPGQSIDFPPTPLRSDRSKLPLPQDAPGLSQPQEETGRSRTLPTRPKPTRKMGPRQLQPRSKTEP